MLRSTFLRSAMVFAAMMSAVAAAGSALCQPLPELGKVDEIAIRGTILAINRANRTLVIESPERDTLTFKAIDRVTNFGSLKPGQLVDMRYYRVTDYLVAKTTPEMTEMARAFAPEPGSVVTVIGDGLSEPATVMMRPSAWRYARPFCVPSSRTTR